MEALHRRTHEEAGAKPTRNEILEEEPAWGYEPEGGGADSVTHAMRFTFELKPEKIEVVEEIVERFVEAWGAMSYPYRVTGYRPRFGEVGKVHFMIFLDEPSAFRGENDAMAVAERAGQGEAYGALMEELAGYIEGVEEDLITYRPALSYTGSPADPE